MKWPFRASPAHTREQVDPDEADRPLPWFLPMFIGAMVMWGAYYIVETPSGGDSLLGDQRSLEALMPKAEDPSGAGKVDAAGLFGAKCAACHQASGAGVPGVFPPLVNSEWVIGDAKVLTRILLHGISGELSVLGTVYKGAMPSFKSLSDAELAALMSHLRSQWGHSAGPVQPEQVKAEREATAERSAPYEGEAGLKAELGL